MRKTLLISLLAFGSISFGQDQNQDSCIVYAPNVATPDCCEWPCEFRLYTDCVIENFHLSIYDHWGEVVFESNDIEVGWDFYQDDKALVEDGVYIWELKTSEMVDRDLDGDLEIGLVTRRGYVTVLK